MGGWLRAGIIGDVMPRAWPDDGSGSLLSLPDAANIQERMALGSRGLGAGGDVHAWQCHIRTLYWLQGNDAAVYLLIQGYRAI